MSRLQVKKYFQKVWQRSDSVLPVRISNPAHALIPNRYDLLDRVFNFVGTDEQQVGLGWWSIPLKGILIDSIFSFALSFPGWPSYFDLLILSWFSQEIMAGITAPQFYNEVGISILVISVQILCEILFWGRFSPFRFLQNSRSSHAPALVIFAVLAVFVTSILL